MASLKQYAKHNSVMSRLDFRYIDIITVIVGAAQSHQMIPRSNCGRIVLGTFLLFTLIIRGLYQGALFQFIQTNRGHSEIHSIDEMMEQDFRFYMYPAYEEQLKDMKFYSRFV